MKKGYRGLTQFFLKRYAKLTKILIFKISITKGKIFLQNLYNFKTKFTTLHWKKIKKTLKL